MDSEDLDHIAHKFWDGGKVLLVGLFVLGLVIGGYVTNKYVDPYLNGVQGADLNSLLEKNSRLDSRNDALYNCLVKKIPAESCEGSAPIAMDVPAPARPAADLDTNTDLNSG